jgi:hypothetical protein
VLGDGAGDDPLGRVGQPLVGLGVPALGNVLALAGSEQPVGEQDDGADQGARQRR